MIISLFDPLPSLLLLLILLTLARQLSRFYEQVNPGAVLARRVATWPEILGD
jgi:hypothetical protein